jgi:HEAT repeat protein
MATAAVLRRLLAQPGLLLVVTGRATPGRVELIEQVVDASELVSTWWLLPMALEARGALRSALLEGIDRIVGASGPDAAVRMNRERPDADAIKAVGSAPWHEVTPASVGDLPSSAVLAMGVASIHVSGYVREAAVEQLVRSSDARALGFLVARANDWVPEVALAAQRGLSAFTTSARLDALVPHFDEFIRLADAQRNTLSPLVGELRRALLEPQNAHVLEAGLSAPSPRVRRWCLTAALDSSSEDRAALVRRALGDLDPAVRMEAARAVQRVFDGRERARIARDMISHPMPAVRSMGLELLHLDGGPFPELLSRALLDPSAAVRETARWLSRQIPELDPRVVYRNAIQDRDEASLAGALNGLGEVGTADDAGIIAPCSNHPRGRVRAATIRALGRLAPEAFRTVIEAGLLDYSTPTFRAALEATAQLGPLPAERVLSLASPGRTRLQRRFAVYLAERQGFWESLALLLHLARSNDAELPRPISKTLDGWERRMHHVFTKPSQELALTIERDAAALSDPSLKQRIAPLLELMRFRLETI